MTLFWSFFELARLWLAWAPSRMNSSWVPIEFCFFFSTDSIYQIFITFRKGSLLKDRWIAELSLLLIRVWIVLCRVVTRISSEARTLSVLKSLLIPWSNSYKTDNNMDMNITITRLWSYLEILSSWRIAVWIEDGHIWRVWLWFLFKWLGSLVRLVFRLLLITMKSILKSFHIFVSHLIGAQLWRRIEHCFVNCVLCYNNVRVFYY